GRCRARTGRSRRLRNARARALGDRLGVAGRHEDEQADRQGDRSRATSARGTQRVYEKPQEADRRVLSRAPRRQARLSSVRGEHPTSRRSRASRTPFQDTTLPIASEGGVRRRPAARAANEWLVYVVRPRYRAGASTPLTPLRKGGKPRAARPFPLPALRRGAG